jgi:hypothetical protein
MRPQGKAGSTTGPAGGEGEEMYKIVDEVDRFFKSIHADIEDWKFSMEDYGDGTRLFVRFQIHFDQSAVSARPKPTSDQGSIRGGLTNRADNRPALSGRSEPDLRESSAVLPQPDGAGESRRADLDLASFVDLWRRKREQSIQGEYHKPGAPFVDARPPRKGPRSGRNDGLPDGTNESVNLERNVPDVPKQDSEPKTGKAAAGREPSTPPVRSTHDRPR